MLTKFELNKLVVQSRVFSIVIQESLQTNLSKGLQNNAKNNSLQGSLREERLVRLC
jgi:hypothetical protein